MHKEKVFDTLRYSNATLLGERVINHQLRLAHWQNHQDYISYNPDKVHTLSLYLQGGAGCERVDSKSGKGVEGTLCLIPKGVESTWKIQDKLRFAHLYFTDESIKRFGLTVFDLEPLRIQVPELTFHADQQLAMLTHELALALHVDYDFQPMMIEQAVNEVFAYLLSHHQYCYGSKISITGGLSSTASKDLVDYIQEHYAEKIGLDDLAKVANMSSFHLQRMFKKTHAISPQAYLTEVRLERAKNQLREGGKLADIALDCGFSSQSHFQRVFKNNTGVTPKRYI